MLDSLEYDGWHYQFYSLDEPAGTFRDRGPIVDVWRAKWKNGHLPSWRDFDLPDFRGWHGYISLCEASPDRRDARYRIWATGYTDVFQHDATGKLISEAETDFNGTDAQFLERIFTRPCIGWCGGGVDWQDRHHLRVEFLNLPLSSDGKQVDSMICTLKAGDLKSKLFPLGNKGGSGN